MTPAEALASAINATMRHVETEQGGVRYLQVTHGSGADILAALAAAGFVVVEKHTDDARAVAIAWCEQQAEDADCPDSRAAMFRIVMAMLAARPR